MWCRRRMLMGCDRGLVTVGGRRVGYGQGCVRGRWLGVRCAHGRVTGSDHRRFVV